MTTRIFPQPTTTRAVRAIVTGAVLLAVVALSLCSGCTTVESDLPWNERQSWEGSPYIPGLSGD